MTVLSSGAGGNQQKNEDLGAELISPESTKQEIAEIYCDMYQLQRLPGEMVCDEKMGGAYLPGDPGLYQGMPPA